MLKSKMKRKDWQRGRRHLDGSAPGTGEYLSGVTISLRPAEIAMLEQVGEGNRSQAVRRLLEMYRTMHADPVAE